MPRLRRGPRGLVADRLAYWALRLNVWACRLDPAEREAETSQGLEPRPPARPGGNLLGGQN